MSPSLVVDRDGGSWPDEPADLNCIPGTPRSRAAGRSSRRTLPQGSSTYGCIDSVHAREQALDLGRTRARPRGRRRRFADAPDGTPSKLSGRRSGLARESSIGLGREGPTVASLGNSPPSDELPGRLERHQVNGPISIGAPLTGPDLEEARRLVRRSGTVGSHGTLEPSTLTVVFPVRSVRACSIRTEH
jgi:hypothetical protein